MKTITRNAWTNGQNFNLQEVKERPITNGNRVRKLYRFTVHTDSYEFQAYGRAELFDGDKWNTVYQIPGELLAVDCGLAYARLTDEAKATQCEADMLELERVATSVTK